MSWPLFRYDTPMIWIAHRGNLNGPKPEFENNPDYINEAVGKGFDVEVDVWVLRGDFYLGHDGSQYRIDIEYLCSYPLWCHAKNLDALVAMRRAGNIHCFWHENDMYTMTSRGWIWAYPGNDVNSDCIEVIQDDAWPDHLAGGCCSDYVEMLKNDSSSSV